LKRVGHLYGRLCDFGHLYRSFKKAYEGSGGTEESCRFRFHLEKELLRLKQELESGSYQPGEYRYFTISDPKERTISVAPFRDRVVHHALVRVIEPIIEKRFIHDTFANRNGKGTHKAVERAHFFVGKFEYFLKADISKYFDSINHTLLLELLNRSIKDVDIMNLASRILINSDRSRKSDEGRGLPIGNLTSQFFANLYLDPLDHHIKDRLAVPGYVRYMDDVVLFSDSKEYLRSRLNDLDVFIRTRLQLRLKESATSLNSTKKGLPFLGFLIFPGTIRVRQDNLRRMKRKMKRRLAEYHEGKIDEEALSSSFRSMYEHLAFADTLLLRREFGKKGWAPYEAPNG
jgi:RNA-directed DNA polymerase